MKINILGGPALLVTFVTFSDFPLRSLSVRLGLSLSPAAYDFNQSLSPADDGGWEINEDESLTEGPPSFSQNSLAEMKATDSLKGGPSVSSGALKAVGLLSDDSEEAEELGEGGMSQLEENTKKISDMSEYRNGQTTLEKSDGSFLQLDKLRSWWRQRRERRARRKEQQRLQREEERRQRRLRRQAEGDRTDSYSDTDSYTSSEGSLWSGSDREDLLGSGSTEEESLEGSP